ncbi:28S ribosomal protein S23, mitochondrial [Athalia rosae]|uniref:28S ribosomal protein S23, mitochondrial n=1 Tax=Athalia rosae TaxID=37344 RepID=UPI002033F9AA|nr:28S ribosomal protein S23, mitochondrial [Athalia rosae]
MARSRLVKIGTIHSRTTGLLRAGGMREEDKPLWLDIYEAFPPKDEPRYDRPGSQVPIRDIFYEEDKIRAKYHQQHRQLPAVRLTSTREKTQTQRFIRVYQELKKEGLEESELWSKAVQQMNDGSGQIENRSTPQENPEAQKINLTQIFAE